MTIDSARQMQEKCREEGLHLCLAFIVLTKAFESVNREILQGSTESQPEEV